MDYKNRGIWKYIKNYKFNSIFIKNVILLTIVVVVPLMIISYGLYYYFNGTTMEEIKSISMSEAVSAKQAVDNIFNETDAIALKIELSIDVQNFILISQKNQSDSERYEEFSNIFKFADFGNIVDCVDSIIIYSELNKNVISSRTGMSSIANYVNSKWYHEYSSFKKERYVWKSILKESNSTFLSSFRLINGYDMERKGVIVVNIDIDKMASLITKYIDKKYSDIVMVNNENMICYSKDSALINTPIEKASQYKGLDFNRDSYQGVRYINNKEYIVTIVTSEYNKYKYLTMLPIDNYQEKLNRIKAIIIICVILSFLVSITLALFLTLKFFRPVKTILQVLENPNEWIDNHGEKLPDKLDEVKFIVGNISNIVSSKRSLEDDLAMRLKLLRSSEAAALQSQINPHFLYNTLETINWTAIDLYNGRNKVSDMLSALSKLLRLGLETKGNLIPIRDEIEYAKKYVYLQKMRYEDLLNVSWDIDEQILDFIMVKLTLQPIIENAIYHGIKPKKNTGHIDIKGFIKDEKVIIEIEDDGVGMSEERLQEMRYKLENEVSTGDEHIGLLNVNLRNKIILEDKYELIFESRINKGTKITIILDKIMVDNS